MKNPKTKIRNSKQIQNPNVSNSKRRFVYLNFRNFEFPPQITAGPTRCVADVSNFDIRISNFRGAA